MHWGAAAGLSPGRQGPLQNIPVPSVGLPGPSSAMDVSAFALLSGEQAASLAVQEDFHKVCLLLE